MNRTGVSALKEYKKNRESDIRKPQKLLCCLSPSPSVSEARQNHTPFFPPVPTSKERNVDEWGRGEEGERGRETRMGRCKLMAFNPDCK